MMKVIDLGSTPAPVAILEDIGAKYYCTMCPNGILSGGQVTKAFIVRELKM
jgi:hypothetical protein